MQIAALILAGGSGTRFWPLSRRRRPKQLLSLAGPQSLLRDTFERVGPLVEAARVFVCTTEALREVIAAELPELTPRNLLCEPVGRNTAPAIAWSIASMSPPSSEQIVVVLPADHFVADAAAFRRSLAAASRAAAERDVIVTLGVRPTSAETGYGYLELARVPDGDTDAVPLKRFVEKPDRTRAEQFVTGREYLWNAGIFVFRGRVLLERLAIHQPELARTVQLIVELERQEVAPGPGGDGSSSGSRRAASLYASLPSISIDYALMERLEDLQVVPLDCGWSDLGSWDAVGGYLDADEQGNHLRGAALVVDSSGNVVVNEAEGVVALVGVSDLVVVRTADALLVVRRGDAQSVRRVVDELEKRGRGELL